MAPKRGPSKGPKAKAKAKAKGPEEAEDALVLEAEQLFASREDGKLDGSLKLEQFAEIVRETNRRFCMLWGEDPMKVIRAEWAKSGGQSKKELSLADFKAWHPGFIRAAKAEHTAGLAAKDEALSVEKARLDELFGKEGLWRFQMKDLKLAMDEARRRGKTPLILDNTAGQRVEAFFAYSDSYIIECKKMIMGKARGQTPEEVMEEERLRFFQARCFKFGRTVVFRLANTACDLVNMFNSEVFPSVALLDEQKVAAARENPNGVERSEFLPMAPDEDEQLYLSSDVGIGEKFNVVAISHFTPEDYQEFLADALPLPLMQPMVPECETPMQPGAE